MATTKAFIPSDPLFGQQWHLLNRGNTPGSVAGHDINVVTVWPDYTGRGVLIGVLDDGMDNTHPDLVPNYRPDIAWDVSFDVPDATVRSEDDAHGVAVAGLIAAAANNGIGGVGVAWGSKFSMYRMDLGGETTEEGILRAFELASSKMVADGIGISSNSWGPGPLMTQEWLTGFHAAGRHMAEFGREGLGIVSLFAGGNDREERMNTNYDPTDNSPWAIIVAASHQDGGVTAYSTPGASILITAPGSGSDLDPPASMVTTDRQAEAGYNNAPGEAGNYTFDFNGTSAATPVAAGVVALMLEANTRLGYRDVQEILAYSARRATFLDRKVDKDFNAARDWNGGALLVSHDFGYGHIDAHAAVRLAESWMKLGTVSNLVMAQGEVAQRAMQVEAGQHGALTARFAPNYRVEQISVSVDIEAESLNGAIIDLVSPNGTVSRLFSGMPDMGDDDDFEGMSYTFNTVLNWGESLAGEWRLRLSIDDSGAPVHLKDWSILAYTAGRSHAGTQIFTDEFARFADLDDSRSALDSANGTTLNAAAVTGNVRFDLHTGKSWIGDTEVSLANTANFRHLISGDGNDILIGNDFGNVLMPGRGSNIVDGGAGVDVVRLIGSVFDYGLQRTHDVLTVESKAVSGGGIDVLYNIELLHFDNWVVLTNVPRNLGADLFDERGYLAQNPDVAAAVNVGLLESGHQHYTNWGVKEGRNPNVLFDEQWYLAQNTDVARAVNDGALTSGYQHYQHWGWSEGRTPSAWMDTNAYLDLNPDVAAAELNPLQHYLLYGIHEGRSITALNVDMWA